MNDKKIRILDDACAFLEGTAEIEFFIESRGERYRWIQATLLKFRYSSLGRAERVQVLRYLERVSDYSIPAPPLQPAPHHRLPAPSAPLRQDAPHTLPDR